VIDEARIKALNEREPRDGAYLLYWMQNAQRAAGNPALEHAIALANARKLPILVGFGLTDAYPEANLRHFAFMLQGLREVAGTLESRGIAFVIRKGEPDRVAVDLARDAALVVCDRGYLRHQRRWREHLAAEARCAVVQVEGDVVVPVEIASTKAEFAARTLRPKLHRVWDDHLRPLDEQAVETDGRGLAIEGDIDLGDLDGALASLDVDRSVAPVRRFAGGTGEARSRLKAFIAKRIEGYAGGRSEPAEWHCSLLSPYLHFGQIAPLEVALAVREAGQGGGHDRAGFLEELIVRRELAINFVTYEPEYDRFAGLPDWARSTLAEHEGDPRPHRYAMAELAAAETHDPYWNAAMCEMVHTGYMHNTMRMYWAKKILEWSRTPQEAYRTTLQLNNRYFLDGRDANSYANVAWTFGLHDRPWGERPVFGKVRYMNARGLERKFDMAAYIAAVERLVAAELLVERASENKLCQPARGELSPPSTGG
jgi:deoxyribodipyrimidine photo-lyase